MPTDVKKITESRREARENTSMEWRTTLALEQIADTLEAIRAEIVGLQHAVGTPPRQSGVRP